MSIRMSMNTRNMGTLVWKRLLSSLPYCKPANLKEYVSSIKDVLVPPVSNRLMFSGEQLKVMIVGGPNIRDDFHIEKGEELFFQLQGSMDLDLMLPEPHFGRRTRIKIGEECMFLLPAEIPHSPQRYANTIGVVIERARRPEELDGLRWYVAGTNKVLYEEFFHCHDLGTQLKPVIERFLASDKHKLAKFTENVEEVIQCCCARLQDSLHQYQCKICCMRGARSKPALLMGSSEDVRW